MYRNINEENGIADNDIFERNTTVRWIPRALIPTASSSFEILLRRVCDSPNDSSRWLDLLRWPKLRLAAPTSKQSRKDRVRALSEQLTSKTPQTPNPPTSERKPRDYEGRIAAAVRRRVDTGDIRGAVRTLANEGKLVEPDEHSKRAKKQTPGRQ